MGAERHGRTAEREAYRAGHHGGKLATTSGEVALRVPEPKGVRLTAAIVERCRGREAGVGEAVVEMRLVGVSTRRIEDVGEVLWGPGVSAATVSNLNERVAHVVVGCQRGELADRERDPEPRGYLAGEIASVSVGIPITLTS